MKASASCALALSSLSFSRYARLRRCLLAGASFGAPTGIAGRRPRQRSQVLGDIFHKVMAVLNELGAAVSPADFRVRFNGVVSAASAELRADPSSRHLGDPSHWPELAELYRRLAGVVERRRAAGAIEAVEAYAERPLTSKDGRLWGKPDAYFVSADGIDLVDYKSGSLSREELLREDYVEQLHLYAYLVQENHGQYPRSLSLIGRDGSLVSVSSTPAQSALVADRLRAMLDKYNVAVAANVSAEELATPTSEGCLFCSRKVTCRRFWVALPVLETPAWSHVVLGAQVAPLSRSARGGGWFELQVERSSLPARLVKVVSVFDARFPDVDLSKRTGQRLVATGLRHVSGTDLAVVEATDRTTIDTVEPTA